MIGVKIIAISLLLGCMVSLEVVRLNLDHL